MVNENYNTYLCISVGNPCQRGAAGNCDGRTLVFSCFQGLVCDCAARGDIDGFKLSFQNI